jgi:hypothetical protein
MDITISDSHLFRERDGQYRHRIDLTFSEPARLNLSTLRMSGAVSVVATVDAVRTAGAQTTYNDVIVFQNRDFPPGWQTYTLTIINPAGENDSIIHNTKTVEDPPT